MCIRETMCGYLEGMAGDLDVRSGLEMNLAKSLKKDSRAHETQLPPTPP